MNLRRHPDDPVPVDTLENSEQIDCPLGETRCDYLAELARLRRQVESLSREVRTDALTGLYNYRYFSQLLDQEAERARRSGLPLSLVMVDLDHFKQVNDQWGHETGNLVLVRISQILRGGVRRIDAVCRYGGEEMLLVLPGTPLARAIRVAERIRGQIASTPIPVGEQRLRVSASFGVAVYPHDEVADAAGLVAKADEMLYQAKQEGRNRVSHPPRLPETADSQVTQDEKKALLE